MAVIIPFADAQAHGSIANSVTFRRHRGKVVFQKKPHARVPGTQKQKAQRQKFKDAWKAFHALDFWALEYCKAKATEAQTISSNWFISQYLTDEIPSTVVNYGIKDVTDLDLPDTVDVIDEGVKSSLLARTDPATDVLLGHIWDKLNVFVDGAVASPYDRAVLHIHRTEVTPMTIPFNYPLLVWWKNFSDEPKHNLIRLPQMGLGGAPSTVPWTELNRIWSIQIYPPAIIGADQVTVQIIAEGPDPFPENPYWLEVINCSPGETGIALPLLPYPNAYIKFKFTSAYAGTFIVPDNWAITIDGWEKDLERSEWNIIFPAFSLEDTEVIEFWIAIDLSLWYDRAMTSIAKPTITQDKDFFIANDFSIYYNKEMTQLANAPYF